MQTNSRSTTWVLVLAAVASLMAALDAMVVSTALTTIRLDLGASIEQLEWTVNGYNLTDPSPDGACEADAIVAYVPEAEKNNRLAKQGRFTLKEFVFDAERNVYRCPAGAELRPMEGYKEDVGGKRHVRYAAPQSICSVCPLRSRCLTDKARRREIYRWEHQGVVDRQGGRRQQLGCGDDGDRDRGIGPGDVGARRGDVHRLEARPFEVVGRRLDQPGFGRARDGDPVSHACSVAC